MPKETRNPGAPRLLKALVFAMFAMFAMTTDSVGTVIPQVIHDFGLGLTAAGSFQYATMTGIGLSAIGLGFLADRIGRKATILLGLLLFGAGSALFATGHAFASFVALLFVSGIGIGIFKAGALALIGDLSDSTRQHRTTMNLVEGFFGVGAIIGPALVALLVQQGMSWKWVYLIAAMLCAALLAGTVAARFPQRADASEAGRADEALRMVREPPALFFATAMMLYVGAEAAIYVWAPTYLAAYHGPLAWLAIYSVSIFFVLRAAGRFFGAWLLARLDWTVALAACSTAIALLFAIAVVGGREVALFALPLTGLFMSVMYPTLNSTGISCFEKPRHGSIAGLLLFFTCVSAVLAPLAMAALGDWLGDSTYAIALGGGFAVLLALQCAWNAARQPFAARLAARNQADYAVPGTVAAV